MYYELLIYAWTMFFSHPMTALLEYCTEINQTELSIWKRLMYRLTVIPAGWYIAYANKFDQIEHGC